MSAVLKKFCAYALSPLHNLSPESLPLLGSTVQADQASCDKYITPCLSDRSQAVSNFSAILLAASK